MESVDLIVQCFPASEAIGAGDRFISQELSKHESARKIAAVTMIDMVDRSKVPEQLMAVSKLSHDLGFEWDEIVPLSAKTDNQVQTLIDLLVKYAPEGPAFYPVEMRSDQELSHAIGDLIREAAIAEMKEEVPHSIAVVVDEFSKREDREDFYDIHASIIVERDSQKAIIIGKKGERLKQIGQDARSEIEKKLSARIFLGLHVKVMQNWQGDPKALQRLGFTE